MTEKMNLSNNNFTGIILADELIHDYEFEMRIHDIFKNEDLLEDALNTPQIVSDFFEM